MERECGYTDTEKLEYESKQKNTVFGKQLLNGTLLGASLMCDLPKKYDLPLSNI